MADTRPLRLCDVCGQLDNHPRHVVADPNNESKPTQEFLDSLPDGTPASAVALLLDPNTTIRHMDCCAAQGCEVCQVTEKATGGVRGKKLIDAIAGGVLDNVEV